MTPEEAGRVMARGLAPISDDVCEQAARIMLAAERESVAA